MSVIVKALGIGWAVLLGLWAPVAVAQDADAATRVQRDAANPLRMIIEAGKLKVRQKSAEAEPEPAAKPAPPAKVAVAKPAAPAAPPSKLSPQTGRLAAAQGVEPAPVDTNVAEPESTPAAEVAVDPPSESGNPAAAVAAGAAPVLQLALAAPAAPLPQTQAQAQAQAQRVALELADYVEPVLNERLRRRLKGDGEVVIEFTVQTDGSVADLAVRSVSDKSLEAAALDAVRQWRYQPIPAAQPHAVQLVFKLKD